MRKFIKIINSYYLNSAGPDEQQAAGPSNTFANLFDKVRFCLLWFAYVCFVFNQSKLKLIKIFRNFFMLIYKCVCHVGLQERER